MRKRQYSAIFWTNQHPLRSFHGFVDFLRVVFAILLLLASLQQAKISIVKSLIRGRNTETMVSAVVEPIGGQYRGTFVVPQYRGTFVLVLVPVPSVLLWYRYRQKIAKYRGTVPVLKFFLFFSTDFKNVPLKTWNVVKMLANKLDKQPIFFLNLVFNCWSYSLLPPQGLSVCSLLADLKNWRFLAMAK